MKKLVLLLILIVSFVFSFAQSKVQRSTGSNTVVDQRVAAGLNLYIPVYQDTVAANLSSPNNIGLDSCGAIIYTRNPQAKWTRYCSPKRWVMDVSISNITINNIFNNSITNTTIINQTDSSVNISICNGQNVCDTLTLVTNVTNVTYSSSNFIDNTHIQFCGLDSIQNIIVCDTVTIPTQVLYTFQRGLNEPAPGVVNFGSDTTKQITLLTNDAALVGTLGDTSLTAHPNGLLTFNTYNSSHNDGLISKLLGVDQYGNVLAGSLPTQDSCGIFNGLNVTWDSARVFDVSPGRWASCCDLITRTLSTTDTVQLDPNDATNPRFDAIIVTQTGVDKVTGTASSNPAFPDIPDCAIVLAYVLMNAGDDGPADVCQSIIYDTTGGSEWDTVKTISSVNFSNTTNVAHAPYSVSAGAWTNNQYIQFNTPSFTPITVSSYTALKFYLKKKATFAANVQIRITWYNGSTPVSVARNIATAAYGYVRTNTNYEIYTIPMPDFGFTGTQATGVRFTFTNTNTSGFYLDWVQLQGCLTQPPATGGIQQWLGTGNTLFDIVEAFPNGPNETITTPLNNAAAYTVWGNSSNVTGQPSYTQVDLSTAMTTGFLAPSRLLPANEGYIMTVVGGIWTGQAASTGYDTTIVRPPLVALPGTVRDTLTLPIYTGTITSDSVLKYNWTLQRFEQVPFAGETTTADNGLTDSSGRVILGGSLYKNTSLDLGGFNLNVSGSSDAYNMLLHSAGDGIALVIQSDGAGRGIDVQTTSEVAIYAASLTQYAIDATSSDIETMRLIASYTSTNTVEPIIVLGRQAVTPVNGVGGSIDLYTTTSASLSKISNQIISKWTNVTDATRTSQFIITGVTSAAAQDWLTIGQSGYVKFRPMTVTEAGAIATAEGLMVFVSNTDGTFTSVGLWIFENAAWHKL